MGRLSLLDALRSRRTLAVSVLSFASGLPLGLVWYAIPDWMRDVGVDIRARGPADAGAGALVVQGLLVAADGPLRAAVLGPAARMDGGDTDPACRARADAGRRGRAARGALDRRGAGLRDRDRVGVPGHRHRRLRGGGAAQGGAGSGRRRAPRLLSGGDARLRWRVDHAGRPHRLARGERRCWRSSLC